MKHVRLSVCLAALVFAAYGGFGPFGSRLLIAQEQPGELPQANVKTLQVPSVNTQSQIEFFESKIRPVLATHCVDCHGPDQQESELRVDHISFLTSSASYGVPIVAGQPEKSMLLRAISHADPDLKMPEDADQLPKAVVADFEAWIEQGAAWPDEPVPTVEGDAQSESKVFDLEARKQRLAWIWQTPRQQLVPTISDPSWARTDADFFVHSKLAERDISPARDAASAVWLRRVYFALTGLPPSPEQILEFERSDSLAAREAIVDKLLASPHFGERWARHWMDLVRYSESRGHESDFLIANAWRYRDYLIQAFNDDVPYDQFVLEHLAGDMLPKPRLDPVTGANQSIVATGWAFLGEEVHSPVEIRKDECDRTDNKIDVLSKTFLGLTVACARCHDHKFDAIRQHDYYALAGFILSSNYRQVRFESMEHNRKMAESLEQLTLETRRQMAQIIASDLRASIRKLPMSVKQMRGENGTADSNDLLRLLSVIDDSEGVQLLLAELKERNLAAGRASLAARNVTVLADFSDPAELWLQDGFSFGSRPQRPGDLLIGTKENAIRGVATHFAAVKDSFWDGLELSDHEADSGNLAAQVRAGRMLRTRKVGVESGRLFYLLSGEANVYAGVDSHIMLAGPLHGHLTKKFKGDLQWHEHNVKASEGNRVYVQLGAVAGQPLEIRRVIQSDSPPEFVEAANSLLLSVLQASESDSSQNLLSVVQDELLKVLAEFEQGQFAESAPLLATDQAQLLNWMLASPELFELQTHSQTSLSDLAADYQNAREDLKSQVKTKSAIAVAWMDGNGLNEDLLLRGSHARPADESPRSLPSAFGLAPLEDSRTSSRLEFASQIVSTDNPLVARVIVNRIWHHLFGRGIVKTVDNFGYLGERPTHPELLDHLAWTFVNNDNWSMKTVIRQLVLSRTFAMSSRPSDASAEVADPENALLHRMPLRRLEAEAIRDTVLAVSGRLDRATLGKPVPVHHTEFVVGRGRPSESGPLDGNGRRSIYTAARRNFLPTLLLTFDLPTPFSTVGRRNVTNVPGQSLALMNDPLVYQQSELWSQRILENMREATDAQRITRMYLEAFGRRPSENELSIAVEALADFSQLHSCGEGDPKVWRDLAHALFSMNEFIYVR